MTRFVITDHLAATRASEALPSAARELAGRVNAAVSGLSQLEFTGRPTEALAALQRWRRAKSRIDQAEASIVLLLHEAGASVRGIADALHMHKSTVESCIAQARADREVRNG
ncbi:chromosome partitioning protein [Mycobacteroides abscessus subsp. massiliense]|uniref:hypothetical protein n=1 Tax=Mycobacteroides abscessus TaxID=36809 RepID=UPI0009C60410|nr:hypothetical protein [Mycobacteroides abscessus]SLB32340.1 chromosome partitioning protein [Mycobacteroides abscessus subsp. massiliense]SLC74506.1 chromosome partitioning protein [Mycobacteroides abscessus subsp. massiliense]